MVVCSGLGTDTSPQHACQNAHGLRAGALIAALGGRRAERSLSYAS
jgi:hypothetical protein